MANEDELAAWSIGPSWTSSRTKAGITERPRDFILGPEPQRRVRCENSTIRLEHVGPSERHERPVDVDRVDPVLQHTDARDVGLAMRRVLVRFPPRFIEGSRVSNTTYDRWNGEPSGCAAG